MRALLAWRPPFSKGVKPSRYPVDTQLVNMRKYDIKSFEIFIILMFRSTTMPLNGLNAVFVTLLNEDPKNPGFEVVESPDKQEIIIKVAESKAAALLTRINEIFKSHGHTLSAIPYRLNLVRPRPQHSTPKVAVPIAGTATAVGSGGSEANSKASNANVAANASANASAKPYSLSDLLDSSESDQLFPKAEFPLLDMGQINGNDIFTRLFDDKIRANTGNIMEWKEARGQNSQTVYYYVCQSEREANLRSAQIDIFKFIL